MHLTSAVQAGAGTYPATPAADCDDGRACTVDTYNAETHECEHVTTCDTPPPGGCYEPTGVCGGGPHYECEYTSKSCMVHDACKVGSCNTYTGMCEVRTAAVLLHCQHRRR